MEHAGDARDKADFLHIWWECDKLGVFHKQVHAVMQSGGGKRHSHILRG